jgi:tetratricopeptide (TPR) repeat protein
LGLGTFLGNAAAKLPDETTCCQDPSAPSKTAFSCPYLIQKSNEASLPTASRLEKFGTVLENLRKLNEASECLRQADHYRQTGQADQASFLYERTRSLSPGSRLDRIATSRLNQIQHAEAQQANRTGSEEQEADDETDGPSPEQYAPPSPFDESIIQPANTSTVETFIAKGKAALARGQLRDAQEFAELARAIDPTAEEPQTLLYRVHQLRQRGAGEAGSAKENADYKRD